MKVSVAAAELVVFVLNRIRYRYVFAALAVAFVYVHGFTIRVGSDASDAVVTTHDHEVPARAQLASFKHPASRTAEEVLALRHAYVEAYADIARAEMYEHGIPASITLAQGLLESVAGTSRLATATNNHFGIKCFSKSCAPGHCSNFDDDHHKDFFRAYEDPRDSYRDHSAFLVGKARYAALFDLETTDYEGWAHGLREAGYATDPRYGHKLISLIERYGLAQYDK